MDGQAEAPAGEVAEYLAARILHLRDAGKIPVHYCSMYNEGEIKRRWPADGTDRPVPEYSHDHHMWWPDHRVADLLKDAPVS